MIGTRTARMRRLSGAIERALTTLVMAVCLAALVGCAQSAPQTAAPTIGPAAAQQATPQLATPTAATATTQATAQPTAQSAAPSATLPAAPSAAQPTAPSAVKAAPAKASPAAAPASLQISYKLDPRLTKSMYMGDRWVSPPTLAVVGEGNSVVIEARATVVDANGRTTNLSPEWKAADPAMVTVSPTQGNEVKITVLREGKTSLQVTSQPAAKDLAVVAEYKNNTLQVQISQQ